MQDDETLICLRCGARNSSLVTHCYYCGDRLERTRGQPLSDSKNEESTGSTESDQDAAQSVHEAEVETKKEPSETAPGLDIVCPRCHFSNQPGSNYCSNCGLLLDDEKAPGTSSNIGAYQLGSPGEFWVRVGAATLDYFVVYSIYFTLAMLFGVGILEFLGAGILDVIDPESPNYYNLGQLSNVEWTLIVVDWVIYYVYAPILIGLWSTTAGKRPFNLWVVKADGGRCGFWRALARELAKFFSASIFGIGYLMVAFRNDRRGLHDLIAGTAVIKRSE